MKTLSALVIAFILLTGCHQTGTIQTPSRLTESSPAGVGMSGERLARIDSMINEAIHKKEIPGAVALVARNGKIVYHKAFGIADPETGSALKKDDIFRIASQTKAITATAVMMLWEEGKFRLDDPIEMYIPEFKNPQVLDTFNDEDTTYTTKPADKSITIRHLLTHTSGIGYGIIDTDPFRKIYQKAGIIDAFTTKPVTLKENILKLAKLPLHFNPGEKFLYSEGLDVLGYFIEVVSGMPLDRFFRERIFAPLEMEDTWFYLPEDKANRLVAVQTLKDGEWIRYPSSKYYDPDYPVKGAKTFFSGGGGLSSTAQDYATFLQMYLNHGELNGVRLLSRTTVRFMMANQIGDFWGDSGSYYGLAFGVVDQKGEEMGGRGSHGTFYWGGYFNTQYFADPVENVIGILLKQTQEIPSDPTGWKFSILVEQAIND